MPNRLLLILLICLLAFCKEQKKPATTTTETEKSTEKAAEAGYRGALIEPHKFRDFPARFDLVSKYSSGRCDKTIFITPRPEMVTSAFRIWLGEPAKKTSNYQIMNISYATLPRLHTTYWAAKVKPDQSITEKQTAFSIERTGTVYRIKKGKSRADCRYDLKILIRTKADRQFAPGGYAYAATSNGLNLRAEPDIEAKLLKVLPYGAEVTVIRAKNKLTKIAGASSYWVRVKTEDDTRGWLFGAFMSTHKPLPLWALGCFENIDSKHHVLLTQEHVELQSSESETLKSCKINRVYPGKYPTKIYCGSKQKEKQFTSLFVSKKEESLKIVLNPRYEGVKGVTYKKRDADLCM